MYFLGFHFIDTLQTPAKNPPKKILNLQTMVFLFAPFKIFADIYPMFFINSEIL